MNTDEHPFIKAGLAWLGVVFSYLGIHTWSDVAAMMASIYSAFLIGDWLWKKWQRRSRP